MSTANTPFDKNESLRPFLQIVRPAKENKETSFTKDINCSTQPRKKNNKGSSSARKAPSSFTSTDIQELHQLFSIAENLIFSSKTQPPQSTSGPLELSFENLTISPSTNTPMDPIDSRHTMKSEAYKYMPYLAIDTTTTTEADNTNNNTNNTTTTPTPRTYATLNYTDRCQHDSHTLLEQCPPSLRHVSQTYVRQADAFVLADQCNKGLPLLAEPMILLSRVKEVPVLQNNNSNGRVHNNSRKVVCINDNDNGDGGDNNGGDNNDTTAANTTTNTTTNNSQVPSISFISEQHNRAFALLDNDELKRREEKRQKTELERKEAMEALKRQNEQYLAIIQGAYKNHSSDGGDGNGGDSSNINTTTQDDDDDDIGVFEPIPLSQLLTHNNNNNTTTITTTTTQPSTQLQSQDTTNTTNNTTNTTNNNNSIIEPAKRRQEIIRIFCVEKLNERSNTYYRNFVATSYSWLWYTFMSSPPPSLHWYEVIREGRPCHLYFDLEYGRGAMWNEGVDGDALVDRLVYHVNEQFKRNWNLSISPQHIYELDSSTDTKFSRHLIIRIPGYAFYNNAAMGHFVQQVVYNAGEELHIDKYPRNECICDNNGSDGSNHMNTTTTTTSNATANTNNIYNHHQQHSSPSKIPPPPPPQQQQQQHQERIPFVDVAVYTKNRHFRIVYSSKGGKSASLQPTTRYAMNAPKEKKASPARVFQDTLVCNVDEHDILLMVRSLFTSSVPRNLDFSGGSGSMMKAVPLSSTPLQSGYYSHGDNIIASQQQRQVVWKHDAMDTMNTNNTNTIAMNNNKTTSGGGGDEKIKELRRKADMAVPFIESVASRRAGGLEARARTVALCGYGTVAYSMIGPGSHFCEHIGRHHKNNHVYYVVDFISQQYAQKCHDPDCSRYRSPWMPLPMEICQSIESDAK